MRHALVLTYYFPPAGGVAVQRILKFCKYLPEFGWKPTIVTVDSGSYIFTDETLVRQVPPDLNVHYTSSIEPFRLYNMLRGVKGKNMPTLSVGGTTKKSWLQKVAEFLRANIFIPDARVGWVPYAVSQSLKLFHEKKFEALITTGPPHSTHLAGLKIKNKTGIKWVADFRDPWTKNMINEYLPRLSVVNRIEKKMEESVLRHADAVTVVGKGMVSDFINRTSRVIAIHNGYDEDDFHVGAISTAGYFMMRHVGNLILPMNVPVLWQTLSELRQSNRQFKEKFRLEFIGSYHPQTALDLEKYNLKDCTTLIPFVSHRDAIGYMKGAELLLFVVPNYTNRNWVITGKIFEYIASGSAIMPLGPADSDAAEILASSGREKMIDYEDAAGMKKHIIDIFEKWQRGDLPKYAVCAYPQYSRKNQTKILAELLNEIT
ncbi:MAG: hypothetical protein NZM35_06650 [Chitinophagales bacterium]|nr:hypothetical protein [Chitinophagales bacterium]MDW8419370.1 hypothetical protein [Chitinophagales bacterium]